MKHLIVVLAVLSLVIAVATPSIAGFNLWDVVTINPGNGIRNTYEPCLIMDIDGPTYSVVCTERDILNPWLCREDQLVYYGEEDSVSIHDDDAKYQVDITIRYNAVSPEEAAKIARQIMVEHSEACKTEVKMKKVSVGDEVYVYDGTITYRSTTD